MRRLVWVIALIAALVVGGWLYVSQSTLGRVYLPSGTGITAKQTCSLTFVSGLDPDRAADLYINPLLGGAGSLISVELDRDEARVTSSVLGLFFKQTAVYRDGIGCTLVHDFDAFDANASLPLANGPDPMSLDADWRDAQFDAEALNAALDQVFTDDGRNTLAALVIHDGHLVAERYAEGVNETTPLHGWSMTKSTAATFAGVLVQRGLLDIRAEGAIPALVEVGRPEITIDDMLRMSGGLDGFETNDGTDPNSEMLFTAPDMAHYAANRNVLHPPGEYWDYQSGNTILAGSAMETQMGETVVDEITTLRDWLFEPLGMNHSVLEPDQSGTLQWSSYMYASARDWARMGKLYLNNGRVGEQQIIPPNWLSYVGTPTVTSDEQYGAGFWLNIPGLPSDTVVMRGFQQQWTFVIPSEDLIILRMGATLGSDGGAPDFARAVLDARRDLEPAAD
jgi:CubicO group peptidase (beta-lactamase class C family)